MDAALKQAIVTGTPGVSVTITAADLREVIAGFYKEEQSRIETAIEATRELPTLTPREVTRLLNVTPSTLWRWEKSGYLVPSRIGCKVLYRQSDIDKLLTSRNGGHGA